MNYRLYKDHYNNWIAETTVMLNNTIQLEVTTKKNNRGTLTSNASCGHKDCAFISHTMFEDFYETVVASSPKRVTEKAVKEQHEKLDISAIIMQAKTFYKLS